MKFRTTALIFALVALPAAAGHAFQRPVITNAEQLPRRSYQLKGTVQEILADDAQMKTLARQMLVNLRADLSAFDIRDNATLATYHGNIAILHALLDEPAEARAQIPVMRQVESKPATRLVTGLFLDAWASAKLQFKNESSAEFRAAFEKALAASYKDLPYAEIREHIETVKAQTSMVTPELVMGNAQNYQAVLDQTTGNLPEGAAFGLLGIRFLLQHRVPLKNEMLRVYTAVSESRGETAHEL